MTNSTQHPTKPSPKLLRTLKRMAEERGVSFVYPQTMKEGREQFNRLKAIPREGRAERRRDAASVSEAMAVQGGALTRVGREEIAGYGSSARWR